MKKLFVSFAILSVALIAVGCGQQWNTSRTAPAGNSNGSSVQGNSAPSANTEKTAENGGEVVVDSALLQLAECITDSGVKMYGTEWCGHCKNQKAMFGDAFSYIDYTDCDAQKQSCIDAGVKGFPTWVDTKGNAYPGTQELTTLAQVAGCDYQG